MIWWNKFFWNWFFKVIYFYRLNFWFIFSFIFWLIKNSINFFYVCDRFIFVLSFELFKCFYCSITKVLSICTLHFIMLYKIKPKLMIFIILYIISLDLIIYKSISICRLSKERSRTYSHQLFISIFSLVNHFIMLIFFLNYVLWFNSKWKLSRSSQRSKFSFFWKCWRFTSN